jgi:hypothetical protein
VNNGLVRGQLAFADADGLAVAEHLVVERGRRVQHLETVVGRRTFPNVLHADPAALPVVRSQQDFPIVATGIVGLLDDQEPVHPGVEAPPQIGPGDIVAVVPARAAGVCREGVAPDRPVPSVIPAAPAPSKKPRRCIQLLEVRLRSFEWNWVLFIGCPFFGA